MARTCSICVHPERVAIEREIAATTSAQKISALFRVSPDAVQRHKAEHIAVVVQKARNDAEDMRGLDVLAQLRAINAASLQILHQARQAQDPQTALKAIDRIQRQIELQAKLLGDLDERPLVNLVVSPEWVQVRATLISALTPYPEARLAVAGRLVSLEGV